MRDEYEYYRKVLEMPKILLVIIDPQDSFCNPDVHPDIQQVIHSGELAVKGAKEDMQRVSSLIAQSPHSFDNIAVTLDSHNLLDISHPGLYRNTKTGLPPVPFTCFHEEGGRIIDTNNGVEFSPANEQWRDRIITYLKSLRYPHIIWPPHCLMGTIGHCVVRPVMDAILFWENAVGKNAFKFHKGMNMWTEHHSVVRAELVDPEDPGTGICKPFIQLIREADGVVWTGEALSHCFGRSFEDADEEFVGDEMTEKSVILTDTTSSVPGFEAIGNEILERAKARGARLMKTTEYLDIA